MTVDPLFRELVTLFYRDSALPLTYTREGFAVGFTDHLPEFSAWLSRLRAETLDPHRRDLLARWDAQCQEDFLATHTVVMERGPDGTLQAVAYQRPEFLDAESAPQCPGGTCN